jgi:hypothetical protein
MAMLDSLGGALSASPIIVAATVRDHSPGSWAARDLARIPVEAATLAGDAVDGVFPSDHRGVVCDFRWTNRR